MPRIRLSGDLSRGPLGDGAASERGHLDRRRCIFRSLEWHDIGSRWNDLIDPVKQGIVERDTGA